MPAGCEEGAATCCQSSSSEAEQQELAAVTRIELRLPACCRTCTGAAAQARAALRRYREVLRPQPGSGGTPAAEQPLLPRRLTVRLPLPSPDKNGDGIHNYDQADWPGGIQQRFRRLRPLIEEHLLAGYEPQVGFGPPSLVKSYVWPECLGLRWARWALALLPHLV